MRNIITVLTGILFSAGLVCIPAHLAAQEQTISLSDAIVKTLADNPGVKVETVRIEQSEGIVQQSAGEFDWYTFGSASYEDKNSPVPYRVQENQQDLQDEKNLQIQQSEAIMAWIGMPFTPTALINNPISDEVEENIGIYSAGVTKKFRSGILITPSVSVFDYKNDYEVDPWEANSEVALEIVVPLLRGLGMENSGARELAAMSGLTATQQVSKQRIAAQVYTTATAFWNSMAAKQNVDILEDTVKRANELYELVELLIKTGELEPAMIHEAHGKLYQRQSNLQGGRSRAYQSSLSLAVAMGYGPEEIVSAPYPQGDFPVVEEETVFDQETMNTYIGQALRRRGDYLAAKTNIATEEILLVKAEDDIRPRLDLTMKTGYAGFDSGSGHTLNSLSDNTSGPNFYVGIRGELPFYRDAARGEFAYQRGLVKEAALTAKQLSNNIASEVLAMIEQLQSAVKNYQLAIRSEKEYRNAADHTNYRVREGDASLTDLINIEDQYFRSRAARIEAEREYVNTLMKLHFVTGTLLTDEDQNARINISRLMRPPLFPDEKETDEP